MLTPATVHFGQDVVTLYARYQVLKAAFAAKPDRLAAGEPKPVQIPATVWINEPTHVNTL